MPTEKSAGLIVFRDKPPKFLLLHYEAGHWDFPRGNIEKGESLQETAIRELAEETGIKSVRVLGGFEGRISYFYKRAGKTVYKEVVSFLAETRQSEVRLSFEHKAYKWLPYRQALEQLTFKNARDLLKKANSFLIKGKNS